MYENIQVENTRFVLKKGQNIQDKMKMKIIIIFKG